MKRLHCALILPLLLCNITLRAQAIAEVLSDTRTVTVSSPTDAKCHVFTRIQVNREAGDGLAVFKEYTDAYHTITDFSGKVESAGKVVKKLKKTDLTTVSCSEGLVDDSFISFYEPGATYPYVVEYDYVVTYRKGIISFPSFSPVIAYDVPVREASYTLTVPSGMEIRYKAWEEPEVANDGKNVTYSWKLSDFPAIKREHNMPGVSAMMPRVLASPKAFNYLGSTGIQDSWEAVGSWLYGIMPTGDALPEDLALKVHELTDDCPGELEKLKALYGYLRDNMRYVSIQFGLGGFSPAAPSSVHKSGWGDCKALSFFMHSLLAEAGVASDYFIVNTDSRDLVDGYPGAGMMNHAMLCVPLQHDTVWVECTNPRIPLGYRHGNVAGHKVVLIDADGGHPVRVPDYPDSLKVSTNIAEVALSADGGAEVRMQRIRRLEDAEAYIGFRNLSAKDAVGVLSRYLAVQSDDKKVISVNDNFDAYQGEPGFVPEVCIDWSFNSRKFTNMASDRMLVPVTLYNSGFTTQKATRVHDLVFREGFAEKNITAIKLPEGYCIEHLPDEVSLSTSFSDYSLSFAEENGCVTVTEILSVRKSTVPAADYPSYRQFVNSVAKAAQSKIVLKRCE